MKTELEKKADEFLKLVKEKGEFLLSVKAINSKVGLKPGECKTLCDKINLEYHAGLENRVLAYRLTDTTVDHYNEVIIPKGVNLKTFKDNPQILGMHNGRKFPVGNAIRTFYNKETDSIDAWVLFLDNEIDDTGVSESFFKMASKGAMRKGSIGFTAKGDDIRRPSPEERERYGIDKRGWLYDKITLLEFSLVTVPANPNAGQIASLKDAFSDKTLKFMEKDVDEKKNFSELLEKEIINKGYVKGELLNADEKPICKMYVSEGDDREAKLKEAKELQKDFNVELTIGTQPEQEKVSKETIDLFKNIIKQIDEKLKPSIQGILKLAEPEPETKPIQKDLGEDEGEILYDLDSILESHTKMIKGE